MSGVYTVTQINSYIKNMFRQDFVLSRMSIKGEVSNCKYHTSGHIYFTLKDQAATLSAVMFATQASKLGFRLENGMQVVVEGRVDVYERDGRYQLYATKVTMDGIGDLYQKFEQLKQRFQDMGYFSAEYKRKIPTFAKRIGIVTASTGAAIHDIMNISYRRNPYVSLILYPALVQGENAKYSIVKGIQTLDAMNLDVIIVGRGGGSIEDLWAFNEEIVAETIFSAATPIISAVGHETDFTIADFVADLRAPTPSAAAELAVTDISQIDAMLDGYAQRLYNIMSQKVMLYKNQLANYEMQLKFLNPISQVNEKRQRLVNLEDRLSQLVTNQLTQKRHILELYASRLNGLSPLLKLSQGYSYTQHEDGSRVTGVQDVKIDEVLQVYVSDGMIKARALEVSDGKITNA